MPARTLPLVTGEYYHVFNRGVGRIPIFYTFHDYQRFLNTIIYYLNPAAANKFSLSSKENLQPPIRQIVNIVSFCFMPNHFHFLLKQNEDDGIMNFMRKISNSYAKYFNTKRKRKGPLFEGKFSAVRIETNEQLLHISRYIHLNPLIGYVTKDLNSYKWSSYPEYLDISKLQICSKDIIFDQFKSSKDYEYFVLDHINYARKLDEIKHLLLEEN